MTPSDDCFKLRVTNLEGRISILRFKVAALRGALWTLAFLALASFSGFVVFAILLLRAGR